MRTVSLARIMLGLGALGGVVALIAFGFWQAKGLAGLERSLDSLVFLGLFLTATLMVGLSQAWIACFCWLTGRVLRSTGFSALVLGALAFAGSCGLVWFVLTSGNKVEGASSVPWAVLGFGLIMAPLTAAEWRWTEDFARRSAQGQRLAEG